MNPWQWSSADILTGKMFVGGIPLATSCPSCHSLNIRTSDMGGNQKLVCNDCHAIHGEAGARA